MNFAALASFFFIPFAYGATVPDAGALLHYSDRTRGATAHGIVWNAQVESVEEGSSTQVAYRIQALGNDALAEALAPARKKGELVLFNDRNLWYFKPDLRKPIAISPRQRLLGQAANGDIASTNYARDYDGKIVGEETVNGTRTWKLDLKAKAKNVTYDRILYWISQSDRLGIRAQFLTVSGKTFKRAEFEYLNQLQSGAERIPFISRMKITDEANPRSQTTLRYSGAREQPLSPNLFNVNNLIR